MPGCGVGREGKVFLGILTSSPSHSRSGSGLGKEGSSRSRVMGERWSLASRAGRQEKHSIPPAVTQVAVGGAAGASWTAQMLFPPRGKRAERSSCAPAGEGAAPDVRRLHSPRGYLLKKGFVRTLHLRGTRAGLESSRGIVPSAAPREKRGEKTPQAARFWSRCVYPVAVFVYTSAHTYL